MGPVVAVYDECNNLTQDLATATFDCCLQRQTVPDELAKRAHYTRRRAPGLMSRRIFCCPT